MGTNPTPTQEVPAMSARIVATIAAVCGLTDTEAADLATATGCTPNEIRDVYTGPVATDLLRYGRCGQIVRIFGVDFIVASRWGILDLDETTGSDQGCQTIILTGDGRGSALLAEWHEGDAGDVDRWVQVERWTAAGRVFHGFVHPASRKIVQAG